MSQLTEHESFACLESWGNCVQARDRKAVLQHYAQGSTLWPTLSNVLRKRRNPQFEENFGPNHIEDYFVNFLAKIDGVGPVEWNTKCAQVVADDSVMWGGIYTFHLKQGKVRARYSYLVKKMEEGGWKIMHHHSSQMPEAYDPWGVEDAES